MVSGGFMLMKKVRQVIAFIDNFMKASDDVLIWRVYSERFLGDWIYIIGRRRRV